MVVAAARRGSGESGDRERSAWRSALTARRDALAAASDDARRIDSAFDVERFREIMGPRLGLRPLGLEDRDCGPPRN